MNQEQVLSLLGKNVNEHTEKKGNLTYLSWAWAWAEALKADPDATYKIEMFGDKCFMDINGTAMVFVTVTMFGKPMTCQLPVMDYKNLSLHGLGLYIYAGEDLPEGEGSDIDVGMMIDHLAAIEAASTIEELKNVYTTAYSACGSDKTWQKKVIDAKEKRKGALK